MLLGEYNGGGGGSVHGIEGKYRQFIVSVGSSRIKIRLRQSLCPQGIFIISIPYFSFCLESWTCRSAFRVDHIKLTSAHPLFSHIKSLQYACYYLPPFLARGSGPDKILGISPA